MHPFVHLHVHSHYSQLDGMSSISGLVNKALRCGMKAIALTDHGNMYGIKEFYDTIKKKNKDLPDDQKLKPILGVEAYCARRSHLLHDKDKKEDRGGWHIILLAKNKTGYRNLCKLVSKSWIDGYYYKPRIDKQLLEEHHEGLIVCSACIGGEIPQKLFGGAAREVDTDTDSPGAFDDELITISEENKREAEEAILWFKNLFGDDYYLELQRHRTDQEGADKKVFRYQQSVNKVLVELAEKTGVKYICSNDVHFVEEEHAEAHDRLICLGTGKELGDPRRMRYTRQEWFKSIEEMNRIFGDLPDALTNTLEIAEKVEYYSIDSNALMPSFDIPETFGTEEGYRRQYSEEDLKAEFNKEDEKRFDKLGGYEKVIRIKLEADYLRALTLEKAKARYGDPVPADVTERLEFELETMKTMGFPGYFLIVQEIIAEARKMGVSVGPGRGSAAGSAAAYCLGITDIDPMQYDLLFERFLNPDRISMPDIDIDFDDDGRSKVLRWVTEKYGREKVANIVTYGTMATKSSIKDVARVEGLSVGVSNYLTKLIPKDLPIGGDGKPLEVTVKNCVEFVPELNAARYGRQNDYTDELRREGKPDELQNTLKYAAMLEGTVRQTGMHACGVIIGADDLTNFVPLATVKDKETGEDVFVTQYEGSVIEDVGLIKMDFLGLKTLSIIKEALKNIKISKGIEIDIDNIPLDDKKTYELYSKGSTTGTFQFESAGMQQHLRSLQPSQFEDLIAMNALYRPGPMQYIPQFINRKHGREKIAYDIPIMEKRLKDTYGITVYQEQVMLLSRDLAGFTRGESDELRKVMGKKIREKLPPLREKFIAGATKNGYELPVLEKIWRDWENFASYAFNKSHATCYSWLSYQTAYLKAHYPAEFMAANLTRNRDDITEVGKFMDECRALGISVLPPDVNESDLNFAVNEKGNIRFGLGGIKGVGESAAESIIAERNANGKFNSIFDFIERVNLNACNKRGLESLALSGAFEGCDSILREQFIALNSKGELTLDNLIRYGNKFQSDQSAMNNSLFGGDDSIEVVRPEIPRIGDFSLLERLKKEKELTGMYLSSHPLDDYFVEINHFCNAQTVDFNDLTVLRNRGEIRIGGMINATRQAMDKRGKPYGGFTLEDYAGNYEFMLFGNDYVTFSNFLKKDFCVLVQGIVQEHQWRKPAQLEFKIRKITLLNEIDDSVISRITFKLSQDNINSDFAKEMATAVKNNQGKTALYFDIATEDRTLNLFSRVGKVSLNANFKNFLKDKQKQNLLDFKLS